MSSHNQWKPGSFRLSVETQEEPVFENCPSWKVIGRGAGPWQESVNCCGWIVQLLLLLLLTGK